MSASAVKQRPHSTYTHDRAHAHAHIQELGERKSGPLTAAQRDTPQRTRVVVRVRRRGRRRRARLSAARRKTQPAKIIRQSTNNTRAANRGEHGSHESARAKKSRYNAAQGSPHLDVMRTFQRSTADMNKATRQAAEQEQRAAVRVEIAERGAEHARDAQLSQRQAALAEKRALSRALSEEHALSSAEKAEHQARLRAEAEATRQRQVANRVELGSERAKAAQMSLGRTEIAERAALLHAKNEERMVREVASAEHQARVKAEAQLARVTAQQAATTQAEKSERHELMRRQEENADERRALSLVEARAAQNARNSAAWKHRDEINSAQYDAVSNAIIKRPKLHRRRQTSNSRLQKRLSRLKEAESADEAQLAHLQVEAESEHVRRERGQTDRQLHENVLAKQQERLQYERERNQQEKSRRDERALERTQSRARLAMEERQGVAPISIAPTETTPPSLVVQTQRKPRRQGSNGEGGQIPMGLGGGVRQETKQAVRHVQANHGISGATSEQGSQSGGEEVRNWEDNPHSTSAAHTNDANTPSQQSWQGGPWTLNAPGGDVPQRGVTWQTPGDRQEGVPQRVADGPSQYVSAPTGDNARFLPAFSTNPARLVSS